VPPPPVCGAAAGYGLGPGDAVGDGLGDAVGDGLGDRVVLGLTLGEASRDTAGETVDDPLGCGDGGGSAAELLAEQADRAAQASKASTQQRAAASITRILGLDAAACAFMQPLLVHQQMAARFRCEGP
jgi:hypothetical protein